MSEPRTFAPQGPLALDPRAFGMVLLMPYQPVTVDRDGITILSIRGPLEQFSSLFCDSYEAIVARVDAAVAAAPKAIVLSISSPGGLVAGCFEAANRIRAACAARGVPLYAYADGTCASAAYALACAASHIAAPSTAAVGSIGVIAETRDTMAANAIAGVRVSLLKTGARKTDGNPNSEVGPAWAAMQKQVDALGEQFFAHVSAARGVSADAIRALDASVFIGADAQAMSLTDSTQTLDELVAAISAGTLTNQMTAPALPSARGDGAMASKAYEDAIAALRKAADGDDDTAKKARRMLKAELADDDTADSDSDTPTDDSNKKSRADDDTDSAKRGDSDVDAKKAAADQDAKRAKADAPDAPTDDSSSKKGRADSDTDAKAMAARVAKLEQTQATQAAAASAAALATARAQLFAARLDVSAELRASLADAPLATVESVLKATPRRSMAAAAASAALAVGTRGEGQGDGSESQLPPDEKYALDLRMGLMPLGVVVKHTPDRLILGAIEPVDPKANATHRA